MQLLENEEIRSALMLRMPESPPRPSNEDGYRLWLRYQPLSPGPMLDQYRLRLASVHLPAASASLAAAREELYSGLAGLLGWAPRDEVASAAGVLAGTPASCPAIAALGLDAELEALGDEGFLWRKFGQSGAEQWLLAARADVGVLYGVFALLRAIAAERDLASLLGPSRPRVRLRLLNHWDNLNGTVERGYAGFSLWDWHKLPNYVAPRMRDYARANASVGINCVVLTNVNANALVLTAAYLEKVAALADVFRPYGIRVFLTARFSAPIEIGALGTADPREPSVVAFWRAKAAEIYARVPDFGGFLVKANSEGQPGPQGYGRSHAEGANLLADALQPHGGTVLWRAFVYDDQVPDDRATQAYSEFQPLDGSFRSNVIVQVKNGPIDFQPREPFHPLFGAMPATPLALELQLTQEYLGCGTHACYLGPLIRECLDADTHARGPGSRVSAVVDGTLFDSATSAIAAVSNIGSDRNWCGHPFAASNWYAFGRLAWDHQLSAEAIADEWVRATFGNEPAVVTTLLGLLLCSREAVVDYMTPLGLHHLMAWDHHYGPGPWISEGRRDWTSVYFHRADRQGIGFDRSPSGSRAVEQYHPTVAALFGSPATCPEPLLLWFHHLPWQHQLRSGERLWDALCLHYQAGVDAVRAMRREFAALEPWIDAERFEHVRALLQIQEQEAGWWRDACVSYFQSLSALPLPAGCEPPSRSLAEYRAIVHRYVPGLPKLPT